MKDASRLETAFAYAKKIHSGQIRRKTGMPRLAHLMVVAGTVLEHGGSEDDAIAGLLHDAVEDAGGAPQLEEIRKRFGDDVARVVEGCTEPERNPKLEWKERKKAYVDQLMTGSSSVHLVAAADKLHNARALLRDYETQGEAVWKRYRGGKEGTLWYYRTLLDGFKQTGPQRLAEELERTFSAIEKLAGSTSVPA